MSLVMAKNSPLTFQDFLGTGQRVEVKQPEMSMTDSVRISQNSAGCEDGEVSTKTCSKYYVPVPLVGARPMALPNASDPTSEIWRHLKVDVAANHGSRSFLDGEFENGHGKKRGIVASRDLLRSSLQLNSEALESSRPSKVSRLKGKDDAKGGHSFGDPLPLSGDFGLSMQPPHALSSSSLWMQTSVFKTDLPKRVESLRPPILNSAPPGGSSRNIVVASGGCPPLNESAMGVSLPQAPADEGSRTGLQGKGIAHLLNTCPTKLVAGDSIAPGVVPLQSKVSSRNTATESVLPSLHQVSAPATRQLTVFYGGQAHVFDDVSSDKADAIMSLAGSSGRSWSTTYVHRPSASNLSAASEGVELDKQKSKQGEGSLKKQGSHTLSSGVKGTFQGLPRAGVGVQRGHQYCHQDSVAALPSAVTVEKTS